jgi:hypothetical protein
MLDYLGCMPEAEAIPRCPITSVQEILPFGKHFVVLVMTSFAELETALSSERLARYLDWAQGDPAIALELYTKNTQTSEALYTPLQLLEVVLRNAIHRAMSNKYGQNWYDVDAVLKGTHQREQITAAHDELSKNGKSINPGSVIAALTFSFWTTMLSPAYEELWRSCLSSIAIKEDGRRLARKDLSRPLTQIRLLRNRVAHHEPILHWDLHKHHLAIVAITRWLSPAASNWAIEIDRFSAVYATIAVQIKK